MELSNIKNSDLIKELQRRGYRTELLLSVEDVDNGLNLFNTERDEPINITDEEKIEILDNIYLSHYRSLIEKEIYNEIDYQLS